MKLFIGLLVRKSDLQPGLRLLITISLFSLNLLTFMSCSVSGGAGQANAIPTMNSEPVPSPRISGHGHKFVVAVVQSGDFYFYRVTLQSILNGLADLGWAERQKWVDDGSGSVKGLVTAWQDMGKWIELSRDWYIDLQFTEGGINTLRLKGLLANPGNVDLVICLGTLAGKVVQDAANNGLLAVPVLLESISDPVRTGIIASVEDSGNDFLTASCDPKEYERQIRYFHKSFGFKRMGIVYSDTEIGRSYAALADALNVGRELGFTVIGNTDVIEDPAEGAETLRAEARYIEAVKQLAPQVDALYLAIQGGLNLHSLPHVLDIAKAYKLPVFAMEGSDFVHAGALMGESDTKIDAQGLQSAYKLVRILCGEKARSLPQINFHKLHIAVNLEAARRIGVDFPVDIVLSADEVITGSAPASIGIP